MILSGEMIIDKNGLLKIKGYHCQVIGVYECTFKETGYYLIYKEN